MPPADVTAVSLGHRFASLDIERRVLAGVAEVVDGNALGSEERQPALAQARAVLLGTRDRLDGPTIAAMKHCRVIVRYGIGVDNVDIAAATRQGIVVSNVRDYAIEEVSDHALALLLAANRHLIPGHAAARAPVGNGGHGRGPAARLPDGRRGRIRAHRTGDGADGQTAGRPGRGVRFRGAVPGHGRAGNRGARFPDAAGPVGLRLAPLPSDA